MLQIHVDTLIIGDGLLANITAQWLSASGVEFAILSPSDYGVTLGANATYDPEFLFKNGGYNKPGFGGNARVWGGAVNFPDYSEVRSDVIFGRLCGSKNKYLKAIEFVKASLGVTDDYDQEKNRYKSQWVPIFKRKLSYLTKKNKSKSFKASIDSMQFDNGCWTVFCKKDLSFVSPKVYVCAGFLNTLEIMRLYLQGRSSKQVCFGDHVSVFCGSISQNQDIACRLERKKLFRGSVISTRVTLPLRDRSHAMCHLENVYWRDKISNLLDAMKTRKVASLLSQLPLIFDISLKLFLTLFREVEISSEKKLDQFVIDIPLKKIITYDVDQRIFKADTEAVCQSLLAQIDSTLNISASPLDYRFALHPFGSADEEDFRYWYYARSNGLTFLSSDFLNYKFGNNPTGLLLVLLYLSL